jgi:hypothetical protein
MGQIPSRDEFLDELIKQVDEASEMWRQGDILPDTPGLFLADLTRPITPEADTFRVQERLSPNTGRDYSSSDAAELGLVSVTDDLGQAIITQTCDVVRTSRKIPYLQLCPVVRVEGALANTARKYASPQLAWLPESGNDHFADLSRVSTVEKSILLGRTPLHGVINQEDVRNLSEVISRRYGRFAFPDDFHMGFMKLASRIRDKHKSTTSSEGACFRDIHQIRAEAFPNWEADRIEVVVHFILRPGILQEIDGNTEFAIDKTFLSKSPQQLSSEIQERANPDQTALLWQILIDSWVAYCEPHGKIASFYGYLATTDTFTLEQMRHTEQVDLDHLSLSTG